MSSDLLLRRKLTLRAHGEQVVFVKKSRESLEHVLMKAFLWALYLPVQPLVAVDTKVTGAFTLTLPLLVLFLARGLDGLTGGNVSVANAYLADVTTEDERSANFGKMAVASNLASCSVQRSPAYSVARRWARSPLCSRRSPSRRSRV